MLIFRIVYQKAEDAGQSECGASRHPAKRGYLMVISLGQQKLFCFRLYSHWVIIYEHG